MRCNGQRTEVISGAGVLSRPREILVSHILNVGLEAFGVIVTVLMVSLIEWRNRNRPPEGDWVTPKSRKEAALVLVSLALFYAMSFVFAAVLPTTDDRTPGASALIIAAIAAMTFTMALIGFVLFRVNRRDPKRLRRDPLSGAIQVYMPSRLAEAGAMLGIPKAVVWGFFGVELAIALLLAP